MDALQVFLALNTLESYESYSQFIICVESLKINWSITLDEFDVSTLS